MYRNGAADVLAGNGVVNDWLDVVEWWLMRWPSDLFPLVVRQVRGEKLLLNPTQPHPRLLLHLLRKAASAVRVYETRL